MYPDSDVKLCAGYSQMKVNAGITAPLFLWIHLYGEKKKKKKEKCVVD